MLWLTNLASKIVHSHPSERMYWNSSPNQSQCLKAALWSQLWCHCPETNFNLFAKTCSVHVCVCCWVPATPQHIHQERWGKWWLNIYLPSPYSGKVLMTFFPPAESTVLPSAFLQTASFLEARNDHDVLKLKMGNVGRPRHWTALIPDHAPGQQHFTQVEREELTPSQRS